MQEPRIPQLAGIPLAAMLSVTFGLFLVSFPIGAFVVFQSDIGGSINYDLPLSELEMFAVLSGADVSIGDAFAALWAAYAAAFAVAVMGPRQGFFSGLSPIISRGRLSSASNYMIGATKWFSVLVLVSALIALVQEELGILITPPSAENDLVQFFYVSLSPLVEEVGFRMILLGIPLFLMYSGRSGIGHFLRCLWTPSRLDIVDYRKALILIVVVGAAFGFAHIALGESWSEGKFAQAAASGTIIGWVYLRYGFVAALLIHWATNYFVFSYAHFVSQINEIPFEGALEHSLMSSLELLLLASGCISAAALVIDRVLRRRVLEV